MKLALLTKVLILLVALSNLTARLKKSKKENKLRTLNTQEECPVVAQAFRLCKQVGKDQTAALLKDLWEKRITVKDINNMGLLFTLKHPHILTEVKWEDIEGLLMTRLGYKIKAINPHLYITNTLVENSNYLRRLLGKHNEIAKCSADSKKLAETLTGLEKGYTPAKTSGSFTSWRNIGSMTNSAVGAAPGLIKAGFESWVDHIVFTMIEGCVKADTSGRTIGNEECILSASTNAAEVKNCLWDEYLYEEMKNWDVKVAIKEMEFKSKNGNPPQPAGDYGDVYRK